MIGIKTFDSPLYTGSPIGTDTSWCATLQYAVSNKLTYKAISGHLDLIKMHCPSPKNCPPSLYKPKKHFSNSGCTHYLCSSCMDKVSGSCCKQQCHYPAIWTPPQTDMPGYVAHRAASSLKLNVHAQKYTYVSTSAALTCLLLLWKG